MSHPVLRRTDYALRSQSVIICGSSSDRSPSRSASSQRYEKSLRRTYWQLVDQLAAFATAAFCTGWSSLRQYLGPLSLPPSVEWQNI